MGTIKNRNGVDLTYTKLYKKDLHNPDDRDRSPRARHRGVSEVKWALGSITRNKACGGDGIPGELFQILKDDAMKELHSICQQIWKTQQWPQDWKMSNANNAQTTA